MRFSGFFLVFLLGFSLSAEEKEIPQAVQEAAKSVWKITYQNGGSASGFFAEKNLFVTNFHVAYSAEVGGGLKKPY